MGHELAHGGRVVGIGEEHFAGGVEAVEDFEVGEFGDELRDGIGGKPLAFFVKDHHGDAGDGLGHGVVAENGVFGHGGGGGQVANAVGAVVDDFAVAGEDGDGAGELLVVDLVLDGGVEALKALGGEADGLGRDGGHVDGGRGLLLGVRRTLRVGKWRRRMTRRLRIRGGHWISFARVAAVAAQVRQFISNRRRYVESESWRSGSWLE